MNDPMWINGTCDRIMNVLQYWIRHYEDGRVSATGRYLTRPGEMGTATPTEIEVPTRKACKLPWMQSDLDYFIKILEAKIPKGHASYAIARDLRTNFPRWINGRLMPGGARLIEIDIYFDNLVQIYRLFEAMKTGKADQAIQDLKSVDLEKIANG